jgi:1,4-alpha-glucan branching enzyme
VKKRSQLFLKVTASFEQLILYGRSLIMVKKRKSRKLESKMEELKKVNFSLLAPDAQKVSLAGDFNDWDVNTHLLQKVSNGTWEVNIDLNPGKYEYRFVVDGEWKNDPDCMSFTPNSFGSENCILKL